MTRINTAIRASSSVGLSDDEIFRVAPSVFATTAHDSRSTKFEVIPTIDVLRGLQKEGFVVAYAGQSKTRDASKREFTKHVLRLRPAGDAAKKLVVGGTVGEIVLKNANDGSAAYNIMAGLFRMVCSNGMITRDALFDDVRVKHMGDVTDNVINGTFRVLGEVERKMGVIEDWSNIQLEREEQLLLAESARVIRFGDAEGNVTTPIRAEKLLDARRFEDRGSSLWLTANRIQEAVIKGGLHGYNGATRRRMTTQPITGIDSDVKTNRALWMLFEGMAAMKKGASIAA